MSSTWSLIKLFIWCCLFLRLNITLCHPVLLSSSMDLKLFTHTFIFFHLDYCDRLHLATMNQWYPVVAPPHWLPIISRINWKILLISYMKHGMTLPSVIFPISLFFTSTSSLDLGLLFFPHSNCKTKDNHSFCLVSLLCHHPLQSDCADFINSEQF